MNLARTGKDLSGFKELSAEQSMDLDGKVTADGELDADLLHRRPDPNGSCVETYRLHLVAG